MGELGSWKRFCTNIFHNNLQQYLADGSVANIVDSVHEDDIYQRTVRTCVSSYSFYFGSELQSLYSCPYKIFLPYFGSDMSETVLASVSMFNCTLAMTYPSRYNSILALPHESQNVQVSIYKPASCYNYARYFMPPI